MWVSVYLMHEGTDGGDEPVLQALGELAALEAHRVGQCLLDP